LIQHGSELKINKHDTLFTNSLLLCGPPLHSSTSLLPAKRTTCLSLHYNSHTTSIDVALMYMPSSVPYRAVSGPQAFRRLRRRRSHLRARNRHPAFLLVPPLLFVRVPSLRGDALFGGPFSSWQVASSSTSPTLDAAAPDVDIPPPFALSGASPSLHARHEEQRFLFLLESFEWLHGWHGHDEARRVADRSRGIS
jgi:hypothetical protein